MKLAILLLLSASVMLPQATQTQANRPADGSTTTQNAGTIRPLDMLYIHVAGQPKLTGRVDVGSDGVIKMPLVGEIKAEGLTPKQVEDSIVKRLQAQINNPLVDVHILKINRK